MMRSTLSSCDQARTSSRDQARTSSRDEARTSSRDEARTSSRGLTAGSIIKTTLTIFVAAFLTTALAKTYTKQELMKKGEEAYGGHCLLCHKDNGEGQPNVFPSLVGSKITIGPVINHIKMVLNGKPGTAMVPFKTQLTDEQIAAIVTYERNSWGNNDTKKHGKQAGGVVQPDEVKKLR